MENLFVPYELALKLKELGFNEECFACYNMVNKKTIQLKIPMYLSHTSSQDKVTYLNGINSALAPTWQQAFSWFREKCNLGYSIHPVTLESFVTNINNADLILLGDFKTYEEARLECLKKLIELCTKYLNR